MTKYYTGVGSRSTPKHICNVMSNVAKKLAEDGYVLRSGAADGADTAFQNGWHIAQGELVSTARIYIPWEGFSGLTHGQWEAVRVLDKMSKKAEAEEIASRIHPAWDKCSKGAKALHTRNVFQVLGDNLDTPSNFLVCWSEIDKNGDAKGGTRTAWMLAKEYGVRSFNLYKEDDLKRIERWIG